LIATSLTVLLQSPANDVVADPIVPISPPEITPALPPLVVPPTEEGATPQIQTVEFTETELVGKTRTQVQEALTAKGLRLDAITGNIAPAQDRVATAYRVNPQGTVAKDTLIAVYFYAAIPQPPKPRTILATPATGPFEPGDEILLEWPGYAQCPSGFPLASYNLQLVGGTIVGDDTSTTLQPEQTSLTVLLGQGSSFTASYLVKCGALSSPLSTDLVIPITPAEPDDPDAPPVE